jgi:hypothetical protein
MMSRDSHGTFIAFSKQSPTKVRFQKNFNDRRRSHMARGVGGHSPANMQKFLKGQHYPASKQDLVQTAKANNAPGEIIEWIEHLPEDHFGGPQDVMKAYAEEDRGQGSSNRHSDDEEQTARSTSSSQSEDDSDSRAKQSEGQGERSQSHQRDSKSKDQD